MKIPKLSGRQREAFSLLYSTPADATRVARALGVTTTNAREILAQLEFKGMVAKTGLIYAPAPWTFA